MSATLKIWPEPELVCLPLAGAEVLRTVKKNRPVAPGQLLARHPHPRRGDVHASIGGLVVEITREAVLISRSVREQGDPPEPLDLADADAPELARRLKSLGLDLAPLRPLEPLVISALDPEPGLDHSALLFREQPETMLAGLELLQRLHPGRECVWVADRDLEPAAAGRLVRRPNRYPHGRPALVKKAALGRLDPEAAGVFLGRDLYFFGRLARAGWPVIRMPLTLQGVHYLAPVGSRLVDFLHFAHLAPRDGDQVVVGGLITGRATIRLERGLGRSEAGLHLIRRARPPWPPRPCRDCRACSAACPAGLPVHLAAGRPAEAWMEEDFGPLLENCLGCGCCALACPERRPLLALVTQHRPAGSPEETTCPPA